MKKMSGFTIYKAYPNWRDESLRHMNHYGNYDLFSYITGYAEFAIYYSSGGQTAWDNNDGRNYLLNMEQTVVPV